ncbi:hypothetical protein RV15_GL001559 [Enterococcus silesiacus]|nr:hypothetical protein [Enterococcus silesiacus]OJG89718.1 hypothetical protein RV15_GL001559 [Enterococcus silesiacus]
MINGLLAGKVVEATVKSDTTEVGIVFKEGTPSLPKPPIDSKLPDTNMPYIPKPSSGTNGKLPSMGDLITSLIWTLLGCSILIVFVGVLSLKNIMLKTV